MVAGERRAPVVQDADQPTIADEGRDMVVRDAGEAEAGHRRLEHHAHVVEHQPAFNPHVEVAPVAAELPGVEAAGGHQPQVDAVVVRQLVGGCGPAVRGEVGGRSNNGHAQVRSDANGHHVLGHLLAQPHPGVEPARDDVGQALIYRDLDLDIRVRLQEARDRGPEDRFGGVLAAGDPDRPGGAVAQLTEGGQARVDVVERGAHGLHQALARFGGSDAAGGAGQQAHAQPLFQPPDSVTEGRLRRPELGGRAGEAALVGHREQDGQVGQVFAAHL